MPLLINNDVQNRVLEISDALEVIEDAFAQLGEGDAAFQPRRNEILSPTAEEEHFDDTYFQWAALRGALTDPPRFAYRFRSDIAYHQEYEGAVTGEKYNGEPGKYMGFVLLVDTTNGELLGLLNDGVLQHVRVGATAGIAAKHLAREDATTVGMLGSGGMARTYAEAFAEVRDLEEITVYSPTKENREAYAGEMSETLGIPVRAVDSGEEAVAGAEIVSACTDSNVPVYDTDWLEDGVFLTNVLPNEISDETRDAVDDIYITTNHGAYTPQVVGDESLRETYYDKLGREEYEDYDYPQLSEVLAGTADARTSEDQTIHYYNRSCGVQFPAISSLIYDEAEERGLGTELPLEWFQQTIRD